MRRFYYISKLLFLLTSLYFLSSCERVWNWSDDFKEYSRDPLNCYLLDNLCKKKYGESFKSSDLEYLEFIGEETEDTDTLQELQHILITAPFSIDDTPYWNTLVERMAMGYSSIVACSDFNQISLLQHGQYNEKEVTNEVLKKTSTIYAPIQKKSYKLPSVFCKNRFSNSTHIGIDNEYSKTILLEIDKKPIAIQFTDPQSQASIIVVCTPLIFTNYSMLYEQNDQMVFHLIDRIKKSPEETITHLPEETITHLHIGSNSHVEDEGGKSFFPFLGMCIIALMLLFLGKRKYRIIPEIAPDTNRTIGFIKQISNVYFLRSEYKDISKKKIGFFFDYIKERLHIDLQNKEILQTNAQKMASFAEMDEKKTYQFLKEIMSIHNHSVITVKEEQMIKISNIINTIYKNLKRQNSNKK